MPTLTFSYDTGSIPLSRIVEGISKKFNYPEYVTTLENPTKLISNPESKADFCKRMLKSQLIRWVREGEQKSFIEQADAILPIKLT